MAETHIAERTERRMKKTIKVNYHDRAMEIHIFLL